MIYLAVDLGLARTGVASCDAAEMLAFPVTTLTERREERLLDALAALAAERDAEAFVVGHPRNMDGSRGESARRAEAFAAALEARTGLPVTLWDERLTTAGAARHLDAAGMYGKKRKAALDPLSAVLILEDYLRSRKG